MLILKTFGGLSLVRDGAPVSGAAAQRRRLALLAMVEAAGPAGISRERLVGLFWGEGDEERGKRNLAQAVYALRRELDAEDLFSGANELRINSAVLGSDRARFLDALARDRLEEAVELYQGRFLDGFYLDDAPEFDRWMETERARLAHDAAGAMETLASRATLRGDQHESIRWWRALNAAEPHNARAAQGLMRTLAAAGDLTAADQFARAFQAQLATELDLPPDPAVAALAESLRRSAPKTPPAAAFTPSATPLPPPEKFSGHTDEYARPRPGPDWSPPPPVASTAGPPRSAPPGPRKTHPSRRRAWLVVGLLAVIIATLGVVLRRQAKPDQASELVVLAVGRIRDYSHQTGAAAPLSDMLATNLARSPGLSVVSGARMIELSAQSGSADTDRTILESAEEAGATQIVDGALYALGGGRYRLDLRRVDVANGTVLQAIAVEDTSLFALADKGAVALAVATGAGAPEQNLAAVSTGSVVAFRLYEEGLRALYTGEYAGARQLFGAALREDSAFAMAAYYYARSQSIEERSRFIPELQHAVELARHASDRERLLITGYYADAVDDPARLAIAETLTVRYPTEPEGFQFLGHARIWGGDFINALPPLRRAMLMDSAALHRPPPGPGGPAKCLACEAISELSAAYFMADSAEAALKTAREWTRAQPTSAPAWQSLALLYSKLDRFAEASRADSTVVRLDPPSDQGGLRIDIALRSGDFATADRLIADYLNSSSPQTLDYADQAELTSLRMQGRLVEALPYAEAMRKRSINPGIRGAAPYEAVYEASILYDAGRYAEAAAKFDSVGRNPLGESPTRQARHRTWLAALRATALAAAGDTTPLRQLADSAEVWGQISGYGRDRRLHHHIRGLLREAEGDLSGAAIEYRAAIFSPTIGYTLTNLFAARVLMKLGKPAEALPLLRSAQMGPFDGPNLYLSRTVNQEAMAQAFAQAGQQDSARIYNQRVAAAWTHADPVLKSRAEAAVKGASR